MAKFHYGTLTLTLKTLIGFSHRRWKNSAWFPTFPEYLVLFILSIYYSTYRWPPKLIHAVVLNNLNVLGKYLIQTYFFYLLSPIYNLQIRVAVAVYQANAPALKINSPQCPSFHVSVYRRSCWTSLATQSLEPCRACELRKALNARKFLIPMTDTVTTKPTTEI